MLSAEIAQRKREESRIAKANQKSLEKALQNSSQHPMAKTLLAAKKHLLYKTSHHESLSEIGAPLVASSVSYIEEYGIGALEIEVVPKKLLLKEESAKKSFHVMCQMLGMNPEQTDVVICQQAAPHVDDFFKGELFRSAVLSTGNPSGYLVGCISEPSKRFGEYGHQDQMPVRSDLRVSVGDVFLLNPQHIHFAMPLEFDPESMLILLQESLDDTTPQARDEIYRKYPPTETSENVDMF